MPPPTQVVYHRGDGIRAFQLELQTAIAETQHNLAQARRDRAKMKVKLMSFPETSIGRRKMQGFLEACHRRKEGFKAKLMEQQQWRLVLEQSSGCDTELERMRGAYDERVREWQRRVARE